MKTMQTNHHCRTNRQHALSVMSNCIPKLRTLSSHTWSAHKRRMLLALLHVWLAEVIISWLMQDATSDTTPDDSESPSSLSPVSGTLRTTMPWRWPVENALNCLSLSKKKVYGLTPSNDKLLRARYYKIARHCNTHLTYFDITDTLASVLAMFWANGVLNYLFVYFN